MPRRAVTKCTRRNAGDRLEETDECCLTQGHCFGVEAWEHSLKSRAEFVRLWGLWRAELIGRWSVGWPGSRPIGCYLAGEIRPPDWRHEIPALRHPVRIGREVVIEDLAWHGGWIELDHLVELGLVDDDEYEAAVERLGGPDARYQGRYRPLADDA